MLGFVCRNVVNSFWDCYKSVGFNRDEWRETSKSRYIYHTLEQDNGQLIVEGLMQGSTLRIPCAIPNIVLYMYIRPDKRFMCLMFHEAEQKELRVYRYAI